MRIDRHAPPTARRVHKRGMKKRAGKMSGAKFPGVIQLESQMEASLVRCMQVDPRVVSLKPQPCTIDMGTGRAFANKEAALEACEGRRYRPKLYTPDLEVKLVDGRLFYLDAKHSAHIDKKPEYLDYPSLLAEVGISLVIVTESLLQGPIDRNAWLLLQGQAEETAPQLASKIVCLKQQRVTFKELRENIGIPQAKILRLILDGYLVFDFSCEALGPSTNLNTANRDRRHLEVIEF